MCVCVCTDKDQKETEIDEKILYDCSEYIKANKILRKNFENQLKGIKNKVLFSRICICIRNYFYFYYYYKYIYYFYYYFRFIASSLPLLIDIIYNF